MKFILITANGLPVYTQEGLPKGYNGELLPGSVEGADGEFGLIVLQEKVTNGYRARLHFVHALKNLFIRHDFFPETFLQALFSLGEDIIYHIEGHGKLTLKKGEYVIVPAPAKSMMAELKAGADYKIFRAVYTEETIKAMRDIFPELHKTLYDEYGTWKPEAREAGMRVQEVVSALMNYKNVEKVSENLYFSEQLRRLLYVMITQGDAVYKSRLYSDKDAALKMQEVYLRDINNPPKIKMMAQKLRMTVNRALTIFKSITGMRPPQYISQKKMEIAYTDVTTTDKPIKTIAIELGFKKQQSFSTKFKSIYGKTPKELRNEIYKSKD